MFLTPMNWKVTRPAPATPGASAVASTRDRQATVSPDTVTRPLRFVITRGYVLEGRVVLHVQVLLSLSDPVQRRLGDVEMPRLDDLLHLPIEEREQQRANV